MPFPDQHGFDQEKHVDLVNLEEIDTVDRRQAAEAVSSVSRYRPDRRCARMSFQGRKEPPTGPYVF
jgi:hypothetical protein